MNRRVLNKDFNSFKDRLLIQEEKTLMHLVDANKSSSIFCGSVIY